MNTKEISSTAIEWIDKDGEEVTEKTNCASCFAPVLTSGLCANCTMIRQLWQEKLSLSQRLKEEVEVRNLALDQTIQLQMVIKDLSLRLQSQGQSLQSMPSELHEDQRTQDMWTEHNALQEGLLNEIQALVKSLYDRDKEEAQLHHNEFEAIDHPHPFLELQAFPKPTNEKTSATVDLTDADAPFGTVRHALSDFVHIVDPEKITHLCGDLCDQGKTMIRNCCNKIIGAPNLNACLHHPNQLDQNYSQNHVESTKPENKENSGEHHDDEHPASYDNKLQDILISESRHRHVASITHEAICHWRQGPLYKAKATASDEIDALQERGWQNSSLGTAHSIETE